MFRLLAVAGLGVRRRALRTALTGLSLTIGVLSLVLVEGASAILHDAATRQSTLLYGPATTLVVPFNAETARGEVVADWRRTIERGTADLGGSAAVMYHFPSLNMAAAGEERRSVDVVGVSPDVRRIRPFELLAGEWLPDDSSVVPSVVVNRAAGGLWRSRDGGVTLQARGGLDSTHVVVGGMVDDGMSSPTAYVRYDDRALQALGILPQDRNLLVSAPAAGQAQLSGRLRSLAAVRGRSADFGDITRLDQMDSFDDQLATMQRVFLVIAALTLGVGSLGILNVGLSALSERAEELALWRALGLSRTRTAMLVMAESQLIALSAAAVAIGASVALMPLVLGELSHHAVSTVRLPLGAVALGVAVSVGAAACGSLAPSIKAGATPIASLLR